MSNTFYINTRAHATRIPVIEYAKPSKFTYSTLCMDYPQRSPLTSKTQLKQNLKDINVEINPTLSQPLHGKPIYPYPYKEK